MAAGIANCSDTIVVAERTPSGPGGRKSRKNSGTVNSVPARIPMKWPTACWRGLAPNMYPGLMSDSRFDAFDEISAVIVAGIRFVAGFTRSIAPIVNCVIFESAPVGVHDVSAIELVEMTVRMKISGSDTNARNQLTSKNRCVTVAPMTLRIGTPTNDTQSGTSMCRSGSLTAVEGSFFVVSVLNALVKISGLANSPTSAPTTIIVTPPQSDHWFTISGREIATTAPLGAVYDAMSPRW